ncbi:MAG: hypothetical protein QOD45_1920, partial [Pseudonocardiales bacterium]|nr:hypothetical protein [Pseudonocardiales bacterium]
MDDAPVPVTDTDEPAASAPGEYDKTANPAADALAAEVLVEEISIDGMCG